MKIITFDNIHKLEIAPQECYKWAEYMLQHKKDVLLPPKISMKPYDGVFCNVMPCSCSTDQGYQPGGVKVVTRYPNRTPSLDSKLLLLDIISGEILALIDANWITAMRTGAVAAHSIRLLAKRNFGKISMLGLGNTARATLLVLASVMIDREFEIKLLKYKGQEELFANRFKNYPNLHFTYTDNKEKLIKGADVIISAATYLPEDLCPDEFFEEGVLVVPIHTMGFTNCDLFFDKIFADDYGHVCHFKNFDKFKYFAEVSDVVNGTIPGRENDNERILAYNIGISMHDVYFASQIYKLLKDDPSIIEIDMHDPCDKFWI